MFTEAHGRNRRNCAALTLAAAALVAIVTAMPAAAQAPSIAVTKTVGLDPTACAASSSLTLPPGGGEVNYCYQVTNTGDITFTSLDLADSELGTLLQSFPFALGPGQSMIYSQTAPLSTTTTNVATWVAQITPTIAVTETDSALVTVLAAAPQLTFVKTVGTDPGACASAGALSLPPGGGPVVYCYQVTNTGNVTFDFHDLVDDQLGILLGAFPYALVPGASAFITAAATITQTTVNSATWTGRGGALAPIVTRADAEATVAVREVGAIPALSPSALLLLVLAVCGAGLVALRRLT